MNKQNRLSHTLIGMILAILGVIVGILIGYFAGRQGCDFSENDYFLKSMIKEYGIRFNVNTAFLRELFPDEIVYLDDGQVAFTEFDPTLKAHGYDWTNLFLEDGVYDYRVDGRSQVVKGIDVSRFQESIDWEQVAQFEIDFAMLRVGYRGYTEGKLFVDGMFEQNAAAANAQGIPIGVYFFSQALTVEEAIEEARFVLETLDGFEISYPIVFDMEEIPATNARANGISKRDATDVAIAFCQTIKEAGYTPMIYGNSHWFFSKMELSRILDIDKWYAQYESQPYYPYEFQMWQYSDSGSIPGINGKVDLNLSFVDYAK